jgi:hypothetical protein
LFASKQRTEYSDEARGEEEESIAEYYVWASWGAAVLLPYERKKERKKERWSKPGWL